MKENQILRRENESLRKKSDKLNLIKDEEIKKLNEKCKILQEEKLKIIDYLKSKLNKNYNRQHNGEKLIAINFISVDQHINHSIICTNKTKFFDIESELYRKYPKHSENLFMFGNLEVNKWKTLEENGINGYTIMFNAKSNEKIITKKKKIIKNKIN